MRSSNQRPNIVLILSDQQRWDTVGAYGSIRGLTPNLDKLALTGTLFETAITCQPVCGPARACIQTGRYSSENGVHLNGLGLRDYPDPTLPTLLQDAGYATGYVGKWHLSGDKACYTKAIPRDRRGGYNGFWRGADLPEYCSHPYHGVLWDEDDKRIESQGTYRTRFYGDNALDALDFLARSDSFFLTVSFVEPHPQPVHKGFTGPEYHPEVPTLRDYLVYEGPEKYRHAAAKVPLPGDLEGKQGDHEKAWIDYLASCTAVDAEVGRIVDKIDRLGVIDNTVVIFTSDHGNHFHTRNTNDGKCSCHDSSLRVPLIATGPGFSAGLRCATPASIIDVPYTICEAAGIAFGHPPRGQVLQTLQAEESDRAVFAQTSRFELSRCLRTRRYKYAVSADAGVDFTAPSASVFREALLFDLESDPHEQENLIDQPENRELTAGLRSMLRGWMDSIGEADCAIELRLSRNANPSKSWLRPHHI